MPSPLTHDNTRSTINFGTQLRQQPGQQQRRHRASPTLLLGYVNSGSRGFLLDRTFSRDEHGAFIQDDFKLQQRDRQRRPALRDLQPADERKNRLANFDPVNKRLRLRR